MQTYIVFDLEWNQSARGREGTIEGFPFEIIEIGAVKLDENFSKVSTFRRLIKPVVYEKLHFRVLEVINLGIDELRAKGTTFADAAGAFFDWAYADGEEPTFCTWGDGDLVQLEKNLSYFKVSSPLPFPLFYYDVQKLYILGKEGHHKKAYPLDRAVEELEIYDDGGFHSALNDALYTAQVFQRLDMISLRPYLSVDYYRVPEKPGEEIEMVFPDYAKYVSRAFKKKEDLVQSCGLKDMTCFYCGRQLKKTVGWFSNNQKQYHCIAWCPEHGYLKGKMRARHTEDGRTYMVKTVKKVDNAKARKVAAYREQVKAKKAKLKAGS